MLIINKSNYQQKINIAGKLMSDGKWYEAKIILEEVFNNIKETNKKEEKELLEKLCLNLGWVYDQIGAKENNKEYLKISENYFKKVIHLKNQKEIKDINNLLEALRGLGTSYLHQGKTIKAKSAYWKALKIKPSINIWNDLGNAYRANGKKFLSLICYLISLIGSILVRNSFLKKAALQNIKNLLLY